MNRCYLALVLVMVVVAPLSAQSARRLSVPSEAQIAAAKKLISEIYRDEYVKAGTPLLKLQLAGTLRDVAQKTNDDPATRYALLLVARDMSAAAGDWEASVQAIVPMATLYDVDAFALADDVRAKIDLVDKQPADPKATFRLIMDLAEAAASKDRFDVAGRLTNSAVRISRAVKDNLTTRQLTDYAAELQKRMRRYEAIKPHVDVLAKDPSDPEANLAVGKFRAFEQNRWDLGVSMLALGSDPELAKVAYLDLSSPDDVATADAWWALADARSSDEKPLRRQAVSSYLRCINKTQGLVRKRIESRLAEVERWHSKDASYTVSGQYNDWDKRFLPLPSLLNESEKYHIDVTEFAFHISDRYAYIVIDLKKEVGVSALHIKNRNGGASWRGRGMTVYLSNSPASRGEPVWRAPDNAEEWKVFLDRVHVGRYLILARDPQQTDQMVFHLRKVKVFGPD